MVLTRDAIRSGELRRIIEASGGEHAGLLLSDEARNASLRAVLADHQADGDVWVFAYGSLIWNPAIHVVERRLARLSGWHRRFCLWTHLGRGTPDCPGLMLGLERGGSCRGIVYRVAASEVPTELDILWRREMISGAYSPAWAPVRTDQGTVRAIAFTINRAHPRYAGRLDDDAVASVIAQAVGPLGTCRDYLENTVAHLVELGIRDKRLMSIQSRVRQRIAAASRPLDLIDP